MVSAVSRIKVSTKFLNTHSARVSCKRVKVFVDQLDLHVLVHRHEQHLCARGKAPADAAGAAGAAQS